MRFKWRLLPNLQYDKNTVCEICKKVLVEKDTESNDNGTVVCPICGAPYHKSCYKKSSGCVYEGKHGTELDYFHVKKSSREDATEKSDIKRKSGIICRNCLYVNPRHEDFCKNCGALLDKSSGKIIKVINFRFGDTDKDNLSREILSQINSIPEEDLKKEIEGVTLSDLAKFTFVNNEYYTNVFKKINKKKKSKFNFCAFWFPAAWFLYRKQYKIGISLLILSFVVSLVTAFVKFKYLGNIMKVILGDNAVYTLNHFSVFNHLSAYNNFSKLSLFEQFLFFVPNICEILTILVMILSGLFANRIYLRHCIKKIKDIKNNVRTSIDFNYEKALLKEGGVDTKAVPLAFLCYIVSQYLPLLFMK